MFWKEGAGQVIAVVYIRIIRMPSTRGSAKFRSVGPVVETIVGDRRCLMGCVREDYDFSVCTRMDGGI